MKNSENLVNDLPSKLYETISYEILNNHIINRDLLDSECTCDGTNVPQLGKTMTGQNKVWNLNKVLARKRQHTSRESITINYHYTNDLKIGRLYADCGFQYMSREERRLLASDSYYDIDIVNAGPTIISGLASKNKIRCKLLDSYVSDRQGWFVAIRNIVNVSEKDIKEVFVRLLNGGKLEYWIKKIEIEYANIDKSTIKKLLTFLLPIEREIKVVCLKISCLKEFAFIRKALNDGLLKSRMGMMDDTIYKGFDRSHNPIGTICAYIYQTIESNILKSIYIHMKVKKKRTIGTLLFDGLLIKKSKAEKNHDFNTSNTLHDRSKINKYLSSDLESCEKQVFIDTGYNIKLICKPM